jgi:hypothetical protein
MKGASQEISRKSYEGGRETIWVDLFQVKRKRESYDIGRDVKLREEPEA